MAINIIPQPISSLGPIVSPNIIQPAITEKTDSKLIRREAIAGFRPSCPIICNVYPTPQERNPAYRIGIQALHVIKDGIHDATPLREWFISKMNIGITDNRPHTKNWMHDILTPSTNGEKWSMMRI